MSHPANLRIVRQGFPKSQKQAQDAFFSHVPGLKTALRLRPGPLPRKPGCLASAWTTSGCGEMTRVRCGSFGKMESAPRRSIWQDSPDQDLRTASRSGTPFEYLPTRVSNMTRHNDRARHHSKPRNYTAETWRCFTSSCIASGATSAPLGQQAVPVSASTRTCAK